ncbi:MAG: hypothetical protein RIS94_1479 [Pseudomonadota bacterium]|jgi:predicted SnoaL-like aldol condensation-catalyzing enzyme
MRWVEAALTALMGAGAMAGMTDTRDLAQAFLTRALGQGDLAGAYAAHGTPVVIEHDHDLRDGIVRPVPAGQRRVTDMVMVDGALFAVLRHSFDGPDDPGMMIVDIWRNEGGRVAEHWSVRQQRPSVLAHGNGMACDVGESWAAAGAHKDDLARPACGVAGPATLRDATLHAFESYVGQIVAGDVRGAILRWLSDGYRQHSPVIADGKQGAIDYLDREWGDPDREKPVLGPARMLVDGDLLLVHRLVQYPGRHETSANVDIFRVTNGQISEHWDFKQSVPAERTNPREMW